jgi:hypothetical protein
MGSFQPFAYRSPARSAPPTAVVDGQATTVDQPPAKPAPGRPDPQSLIADVLMLGGAAAFTIGVGLLSRAAGYITGGVLLALLALMSADGENK